MNTKKQLLVSALKNGTVIDHIPADSLFNVITILGLDKIKNQITFGTNLQSQKLGAKAIIKISEKYFQDDDINRIALVAPSAKLNIIKDYKVQSKTAVEIPDVIEGIAKCFNPNCITNNDKVKTKFYVISKRSVKLRCHYCEKITDHEHLEIQ